MFSVENTQQSLKIMRWLCKPREKKYIGEETTMVKLSQLYTFWIYSLLEPL